MLTEVDLHRELEAAQSRAREAMDVLVARGVSVTTFMKSGWPGVERVATVGRLWHPDPCGKAMVILPAWLASGPLYESDPILADLIAFAVDQPDRWHYRDGKPGLVLGNDHLDQALHARAAICLHRSPLAWLRAGCQGAVILEDAERRHGWGIAA
jgi:hypothetical protein